MNEEENPQKDSQAKPQAEPQARPETTPTTEPNASMPSKDAGWAGASPTQVMRTVAIALLTAAVVLGAFFLLWQVRTFVGWFVIALFLAAVLNPAVNWLQRRHHLIKRPLAIALTYLGVLVALLFVAGIFLPLLVDQVRGLINFVVAAAQAPEGPTEYIRGIAEQSGLGGLFERFGDQIAALRDELGQLLGIPGALLAIPVAEIIRIVATDVLAYRRERQTSPPSRPRRLLLPDTPHCHRHEPPQETSKMHKSVQEVFGGPMPRMGHEAVRHAKKRDEEGGQGRHQGDQAGNRHSVVPKGLLKVRKEKDNGRSAQRTGSGRDRRPDGGSGRSRGGGAQAARLADLRRRHDVRGGRLRGSERASCVRGHRMVGDLRGQLGVRELRLLRHPRSDHRANRALRGH